MAQLIDYADKKYDEEVCELMQSLPEQKRIDALIDILFDPRYASDENSAVMLQALVLVSGKYPEIGNKNCRLEQYSDWFRSI